MTDSVGIGLSNPVEKLDVNGNIRSRNNLFVDNVISATGNINGGSFTTAGTVSASGNGLFFGDLTTNSSMVINNNDAILQLKSGGISKGFLQLSGNDVRIGTNSGNTSGHFIVRINGDNIMDIEPGGMSLNGGIFLGGGIFNAVTTTNLLPLTFGQINEDGTIKSGSGNFTCERIEAGLYSIHCSGVNSKSVILITSISKYRVVTLYSQSAGLFYVESVGAGSFSLMDGAFHFLVYSAN